MGRKIANKSMREVAETRWRMDLAPGPELCGRFGLGRDATRGDLGWRELEGSMLGPAAPWLARPQPAASLAWRTIRRHLRVPADQIDSRCAHTAPRILLKHPPRPALLPLSSSPLVRHCFTHAKMAGPPPVATKPAEQYRLPTNVKPVHYDVTIRTDLKALKFDGYVTAQYVLIQPFNTNSYNELNLLTQLGRRRRHQLDPIPHCQAQPRKSPAHFGCSQGGHCPTSFGLDV